MRDFDPSTAFKFGDDRVVLNVTADQVKTLPKLEK